MTPITPAVDQYYADPSVRRRIREYFGAEEGGVPTAAQVAELTATGPWPIGWETARHRPAAELEVVWTQGADLARSLRDSACLLFFIDLDHHDPDNPGGPFVDPAGVFLQMEPAYRAVVRTLSRFGLMPLILMTGRGYHFVGRIPIGAPVVDALADLVPAQTDDAALAGLGRVVEYAAHVVLRSGAGGQVPIVVNGLPVGQGAHGRAAVSIDFSHVGDPVDSRFIRSAFGTYQWHRFRPDIFGARASAQAPLATVPRGDLPLDAVLQRGRSLAAGCRIARESSVVIPDVSRGVEGLVADYQSSRLAEFHRRLDAGAASSILPELPADLPPCVMAGLSRPNDLLLKPEHLQHLVRALLSRGWEAPQVAALVQRIYQTDHQWGDRWDRRMQPSLRAAFEVRVYAGLVATGTDGLLDFNCVSAQEKGLCPRVPCSHDLRIDRDALLRRTP